MKDLDEVYCVHVGGYFYALLPVGPSGPALPGASRPYPWRGYRDGEPCGYFRTKSDFRAFARAEPPKPRPLSGHVAQVVDHAELLGRALLDRIETAHYRRKIAQREKERTANG